LACTGSADCVRFWVEGNPVRRTLVALLV
jgi:hypothetical protein